MASNKARLEKLVGRTTPAQAKIIIDVTSPTKRAYICYCWGTKDENFDVTGLDLDQIISLTQSEELAQSLYDLEQKYKRALSLLDTEHAKIYYPLFGYEQVEKTAVRELHNRYRQGWDIEPLKMLVLRYELAKPAEVALLALLDEL